MGVKKCQKSVSYCLNDPLRVDFEFGCLPRNFYDAYFVVTTIGIINKKQVSFHAKAVTKKTINFSANLCENKRTLVPFLL
jgi:hypothetical protein